MARRKDYVTMPFDWWVSDQVLGLPDRDRLWLLLFAGATHPWGRGALNRRLLADRGHSMECGWNYSMECAWNLAGKGLVSLYEWEGDLYCEIVGWLEKLPSTLRRDVSERYTPPCPSADDDRVVRVPVDSIQRQSSVNPRIQSTDGKCKREREEREEGDIREHTLHACAHEAATSAPPSRSSTFLEPSAADRNPALAAMSAAAAPLPNSVEAFGPEDAPYVRRWVQTLAQERSDFLGEAGTLSAAEVYASVSRSLLALRDKCGSEKFQAGVERHIADRPQGFTNEWLSKAVDALGHRIRWAYEDAARQDRQAADGGKVVPFQRPERECNDQPQGDLGTGHWELRAARLRAGVDEIAALLEQGDYEAKFKARSLDSLWGQGTSMQIPDDQFGMGETRKLWVTVRAKALALKAPPRPSFSAATPEEGVA